jgi:hypothetical protein
MTEVSFMNKHEVVEVSRKKSTLLRAGAALATIVAVLVLISLPRNTSDMNEADNAASPELTTAAEGLNDVLPQRIAQSTYFDSVGVSKNSMSYYYSLENLSEDEFLQKGLMDSLMSEAENRVPCTTWRPVYMQGVDVSFIYYSNDGKEILHFTRSQSTCCAPAES